jgi:3'(2'), 5'-bisphosphate nucleotidase
MTGATGGATGSALSRELEVAERLAREAGALVLGMRGPEIDVEMKAGNEPVTEADRGASQLILRGLAAAFPGDVHISEENADDLRRLDAERVWYVDPIDGTKDFIRGHEGFAVMIGLAVQHRPVLGVVYQPVHERLFLAAGDQAWFQAPDQAPRRLHVSRVVAPSDLRLVASKSNRTRKIDEVKSALGIRDEINLGSVGLKLCLIALAERDLYVNPSSNSKVWDTCAPEAILRAAGGRITDVHGEPLHYDHRDVRRRRGLVASNGLVHDEVIARLGPLFARR